MVRVPWEKLAESPRASESLVTLLMLRLREEARAVDGSGGDGGRDLFEYTDSGELIVYEAKSFTGRMNPVRRRQVARSLVSAARHQPDHWDLLVPIDPNPAEERWFKGLREQFPFVREWVGRSRLDEKFAAHPDLVRYALQESGDYILERIAEARAERDVLLGGLPDYLERGRALHARVQEISPHYAVHTTLGADGQTVVHLVPKGPGPDEQAAIRFTGRIRFADGDQQEAQRRARYEETLRFGGEVELTADNLAEAGLAGPAGLGLERLTLGRVRITSPRQEVTPPLQAQLVVQQPSGIPVTSLPVTFTQRVTGLDGGTLQGRDGTGMLRVQLRYTPRNLSGRLKFSFELPESVLPQTVVPVLRLIAQSRPGHFMELVFAGSTTAGVRAPITAGMTPPGWEADEAQFWADAFDDLARLQSRTGHFFPLPHDFTKRDVREVRETLTLLDGKKIVLRGKTVSVEVVNAEGLDQLADIRIGMFRLTAGYESMIFTLGDHQIDLGPCTETYTMDKILNMGEARRELAAHGHATVVLRLAGHIPAVRYLGTERPE
ncbi:hypothetical protein [Streptomyces scabiei]|uniref:hypothetical protein n=3 Tax=Streptomyces scabiei TaxID=1930 RepID=UPI000A83D250|nr:hypothetical protein [Streptomyces scabiei]